MIVSLAGVIVSSDHPDITLEKENCPTYNFTDGCGLMSQGFAEKIAKKNYTPSVVQLRHKVRLPSFVIVVNMDGKGYKGVLMVDPKLEGCQIIFRKSMQKFKSDSSILARELGVVEFSHPSREGAYLNKQLIMVLSELGISDDVLLDKQRQHLFAPRHPFLLLKWALLHHPAHAARILEARNNGEMDTAINNILRRIDKQMKGCQESLRVLVPLSRIVFGVADISGRLKYGQCFFRPTIAGTPRTLKNGKVAVSRNPCYHPGDLRVLEPVDIPELSHLRDCIVFPVEGPRPHAHEMSGGDLDGDKFFVTWDPDLVPSRTCEPFPYDENPPKAPAEDNIPEQTIPTADDMARYAT